MRFVPKMLKSMGKVATRSGELLDNLLDDLMDHIMTYWPLVLVPLGQKYLLYTNRQQTLPTGREGQHCSLNLRAKAISKEVVTIHCI